MGHGNSLALRFLEVGVWVGMEGEKMRGRGVGRRKWDLHDPILLRVREGNDSVQEEANISPYKEDIVNFICYWQPCCRLPRFSEVCTSETHFLLSIFQALISSPTKQALYSAISLRIWQSFSFNWEFWNIEIYKAKLCKHKYVNKYKLRLN